MHSRSRDSFSESLSRRNFLQTLGLVCGASLLAACGPSPAAPQATSAPTVNKPSPTNPSAAKPTTAPATGGRPLRKFIYGAYTGAPARAGDLTMALPQLKGWYQEVGIEYERVALSTTPVQFAALDSGKADAISDTSNPVFLRPKGIDAVVVLNDENSQTQYGMARPNFDIRDPNAWVGAKVRVSGLGENTTYIFMSKMIKDVGGDPSKVQFIAAPSGASYQDETNALKAGTFDATSMFQPAVSFGLRNGLQKLGYLPDALPYPGAGMVASSARLKDPEYRTLLKDMLRAVIRGKKYMKDPANRAEILEILRGWAGNPPDLEPSDYNVSLDERLEVMTIDGRLKDPQVYRGLFTVAFELGILNPKNYPADYAKYDFRQMVDYSLIEQALAEEGRPAA